MKLTEDTAFSARILDGVLDRMLGKYDNRKRWQKDEDPHLSELLYCLTSAYWQGREEERNNIDSPYFEPSPTEIDAFEKWLDKQYDVRYYENGNTTFTDIKQTPVPNYIKEAFND